MIFEKKIFPIIGPLKEPLLILEAMIIFFFFELSIISWLRVRKKKHELKSLQEKAYIWLFLGYAALWYHIVMADHYIESPEFRIITLNIGFTMLLFCVIFFIYFLERNKVFIRKYLFTIIMLILLIIYIFVFIFALEYGAYVSSFTWIIFLIFFLVYAKELTTDIRIKSALKNFRLMLFGFFLGVLLIAGGYQLTTRALVMFFGYEIRLIGDIFQLVGIFLIYEFFTKIPSFAELEWQDKIESVLVMHKSGLYIFKKSFKEQGVDIDESVLSGTMTSLKLLLEKLTKREGLSIIEQGGKYIIIDTGEFLYAAVVCDENLAAIRLILHQFLTKIETIYYDILTKWDRDLKVFRPIEDIAKEFFL